MLNHSNLKVLSAFAIGGILVSGAYLAANNKPDLLVNSDISSVTAVESPPRLPIAVADSNNDGIEDWQEVFVDNIMPITNGPLENYIPPETLTGAIGVSFFQEMLGAKAYQGIGRSREQIIEDTGAKITAYASDKIFTTSDLILNPDSSTEAIRTYANAHAEAIKNSAVPGVRNELVVLREVLNGKAEPGLQELELISQIYLNTRETVLQQPVPNILAKEHLDLINVYNALYNDVSAMTKALSDPMLTFVRIRRYQEDVDALTLALGNMYFALKPYMKDFKSNDSALLFNTFNPDLR